MAAALCLRLSVPALAQQPPLTIFPIRMGQGDATLILGPDVGGERVSVLIDAENIPPGGYDGGEVVQNDVTITTDGESYTVSTARRFGVDE